VLIALPSMRGPSAEKSPRRNGVDRLGAQRLVETGRCDQQPRQGCLARDRGGDLERATVAQPSRTSGRRFVRVGPVSVSGAVPSGNRKRTTPSPGAAVSPARNAPLAMQVAGAQFEPPPSRAVDMIGLSVGAGRA
jgi:hypothetical protein